MTTLNTSKSPNMYGKASALMLSSRISVDSIIEKPAEAEKDKDKDDKD